MACATPFVAALLAVSCGEVLASAPNDPPDGGPNATDAASESTAESPDGAPPACDPAKPFVARPVAGDVNSAENDACASLTADETRLFFVSTRDDSRPYRIHEATRDGAGAYVGSKVVSEVALLDPPAQEFFVHVRGDGTRLVFTSTRQSSTAFALDLWFSTQAAGAWSTPQRLFASSALQDQAPFIDEDETLWFSEGNGVDEADIFTAKSTPNGYMQADALPANINVAGEDSSPVLSADRKTLYFATTRRRAGTRSFEIFVATRATVDGAFGEPTPLADLEGTFDQRPSWVSRDGCRLYFTRNETATKLDLWVAEKPR